MFEDLRICHDNKEIEWIYGWYGNSFGYRVGMEGVTKIVAYEESGQYGLVPYLAVYCGDEIKARVSAEACVIEYKMAQDA